MSTKPHRDWRPRLSIEISQDQYEKLQRLLPWGVKNQLFRVLIDDLINVLDSAEGDKTLGALLSGKVSLNDLKKS